MLFNKELILQPNTHIHCATEVEATALLRWARSIGRTWCDGKSYTVPREAYRHSIYGEYTIHNIREGTFGDKRHYSSATVYSFKDVSLTSPIISRRH
jgi:hypothetical protein